MKKEASRRSPNDIIYGLGVIGAAAHFISEAAGFWSGFLGLIKALLWPAFLIYELLQYIGA